MSTESPRIVLGVEDIDRKYEVLEKLAEGGMGAIYKARHLLLDEVRVIKTVRPQYRDDPELRERFLREARVATHLHHPNIARIHDLSVGEDGTACIVMEFVHGINLADRLQQGPRLEQREVLELAGQTLDALGYLHQRKIVHRDISPDNIMLARDADGQTQVKLIDLGIAKPLDGAGFQTKTAMFIGKVRYASPEQLGGGQAAGSSDPVAIDGRSDLYSLGVVLYELLTGAFPIRGTDEASVIAGHLFHPPREFSETDPEGRIAEPLRRALLHALQKDPGYRFQSAADFARALRQAADGDAGEETAGTQAARTLIQTPTPPGAQRSAAGDPTVLAPGTATSAGVSGEPAPPDPTVVPGATDVPARTTRRRPLVLSLSALVAVLMVVGGIYLLRALADSGDPGDTQPIEDPLAGIDFGSYKALVIGNDDYASMPDLETATSDALDVAQVLEDRYGFRVTPLLDAKREELMNALHEFTSEAEPTDNLLIYYAGHGSLTGPGASSAAFWLPVDAQPMEDSNWVHAALEITPILERSPARHVLVLADSCYSASLATQQLSTATGNEGETEPPLTRERVVTALRQPSRLVIASGGLKPVPDSAGDGHSVFSGVLLDILRTNERLLPVDALYDRLTPRAVEAYDRLKTPQRPQFGQIEGARVLGRDFFFVPRQGEESSAGT